MALRARWVSTCIPPQVYGGAVDRVEGREPKMGEPVLLMDHTKRTAIGWGVFNPESMYRVRVSDPSACVTLDALVRRPQ